MPSPSPNRAQQTRTALIEQGIRAFGELGHDRVNLVADILEPAGVNPGSFYFQFADKTDLLLAVLDEAGTRRAATILAPMEGSAEDIIATIMGRFFDSIDDEDHLWAIQSRERSSAEPRIRDLILQARVEWIEGITSAIVTHTNMPEEDARRVAEMIVVFGVGLVAFYLDLSPDERAQRRDRLHDAATQFVVTGATAMVLADPTTPRNAP